MIHRDIKPDNILLDEDDENAYLADFGIAQDTNLATSTAEGVIIGSPAYLTPEQIKGEPVTPRTDIYSLGLVIYEMLVNEKALSRCDDAGRIDQPPPEHAAAADRNAPSEPACGDR